MTNKNLENFQKLVSNENSGWLDKFLQYKANKKGLDYSLQVAVNVLETLKAKEMEKQQERSYSEEDMLNFAWFLIKNVGQYSDDRIAHFEGKYLEKFKKQITL